MKSGIDFIIFPPSSIASNSTSLILPEFMLLALTFDSEAISLPRSCSAPISSEKNITGCFCNATLRDICIARALLPIPGRAARTIRSVLCNPDVFMSRLWNPVEIPVTSCGFSFRCLMLAIISSIVISVLTSSLPLTVDVMLAIFFSRESINSSEFVSPRA